MSNLNTKNCESECLSPVRHSSQKHSLERSGTQSTLHRDLEVADTSIRKITEIMQMAVTYTTCGVIRIRGCQGPPTRFAIGRGEEGAGLGNQEEDRKKEVSQAPRCEKEGIFNPV